MRHGWSYPMMGMFISVIIMAASLATIAKASHLTISSIEDLIELIGLSEASAGFVILAVMTSIPEMTVATFSILQGVPGIAVGDILGSNVFNIGIAVGIIAVIGSLKKVRSDFLVEMVDILFLSSAIPILLVMPFLSAYLQTIGRIVGAIFIGIFVLSIYVMTKAQKVPTVDQRGKVAERRDKKLVVAKVVGGTTAVVLAARLTVWSASNLATALGVPPILIGAK